MANLSGEVGLNWPNVMQAVPFIKTGRIRGLAVTSAKRSKATPDVPAIAESGVAGLESYDFTPWQIMAAPAGTPPAIVALLNEHLVKALRSPDIVERLTRDGADIIASSQADAAKHVQTEIDKWRRVIKERGMRAE